MHVADHQLTTKCATDAAMEVSFQVLPDIQDEHGDVTRDEHLETGIPGTRDRGHAHGGAGMLMVTRRALQMTPGWSC